MVIPLIALLVAAGQQPTPLAPPVVVPKPKLVCREGEVQLGSHVHSGARCLTQEQWDEEDAKRDRVPVTLRVTAGQGDGQPTRSQPHQ